MIISNSSQLLGFPTVPVIANFNTNGCIKPLYVRIQSEALPIVSYDFQSFVNTIVFNCTVNDLDTLKSIKLVYHKNECQWTLHLPSQST